MKRITILLTVILFHQISLAQSYWKQLNGPLGGNVNCLLNNNGIFYTGTDDGVFVSVNRGSEWIKKSNGLKDWTCIINAFAALGNNVFAATYGGVFMSSDQGNSWIPVHSTPSFNNMVASLATNGNNLYEATRDSGVFVSYNGGTVWKWISENLSDPRINAVCAIDDKIFAGDYDGGLFVTTDSGKTWTSDTLFSTYGINSITSHNGELYAGVSYNSFNGATYVSKDTGKTWKLLGTNSPSGGSYAFEGSYIFSADFALSVSADSGADWNYNSNQGNNFYCLLLSGDTLFAGTGTGILWSNDSAITWHTANAGLCNANVYSIIGSNNNIFASSDRGLYLSSDDGNNWTPVNNGLGKNVVLALAVKENKIFAGSADGIFVSDNNGISWTSINNNLPTNTTISTIAFQGNNIYISSGDYAAGTYLSKDDGASWNPINKNLPANIGINAFGFLGDTVYACIYNIGPYYSVDSGKNWLPVNLGFSPSYSLNYGIAINDRNIVMGNGDIIYSKNGGVTWNEQSMASLNQSNICVIATLNDTTYAGDALGGLYMTPDTCTNWYPTSPLNLTVTTFATGNGSIYMGGLGSGVWKHFSSNIINNIELINKLNTIILFPNPAKNTINVNAGLNNNRLKTASVYNLFGQIVAQKNNCQSVFNMDISSFPNGIYLIKVMDDNGVSNVGKFVKQ